MTRADLNDFKRTRTALIERLETLRHTATAEHREFTSTERARYWVARAEVFLLKEVIRNLEAADIGCNPARSATDQPHRSRKRHRSRANCEEIVVRHQATREGR